MTINKSLELSASQYYQDVVEKSQLYLHHTVGGSAESTFKYWDENAERVGTAFIVERDGEIFQVFEPHYWAHHLGLRHERNRELNMHSIGIEMASEGALRSGEELNQVLRSKRFAVRFDESFLYAFDIDIDPERPATQWFSRARRLYHIENDKGKYLQTKFRGYDYFDAYNEEQVLSVFWLTRYLSEIFPTILLALPTGDRTRFDQSLFDFKGVLGHHNVRPDKSDLHPGWPWTRMEQYLASPEPLSI